ncbi:hypothetical protein CsSME_00019755 [Camellia sinensis var. sinensis]
MVGSGHPKSFVFPHLSALETTGRGHPKIFSHIRPAICADRAIGHLHSLHGYQLQYAIQLPTRLTTQTHRPFIAFLRSTVFTKVEPKEMNNAYDA